MLKFKLTQEFDCDEATFWKTFFDRDFNQKLYVGALGFARFEIASQTEDDRSIARKIVGQPKLNLPGPVAKLLGANFSYSEEGRFDKATRRWRWKLIPGALADRLRQDGEMWIEPIGAAERRVRRVADLTLEAKVFGLGGLIESTMEKQLRDGWAQAAAFQNKHMAEARA